MHHSLRRENNLKLSFELSHTMKFGNMQRNSRNGKFANDVPTNSIRVDLSQIETGKIKSRSRESEKNQPKSDLNNLFLPSENLHSTLVKIIKKVRIGFKRLHSN